ncbi:hypothetical protein HDV06_005202 [Boothiomyces sp. JEL0866]|nr:hypothetical protein HDV06_005202 [Boothiomyces sp. JEL0866]
MPNQFVSKTSYRVYKTNDAKTLIENPARLDINGAEPTTMLSITDTGITVGDKTAIFPASANAIIFTQEIMGLIGIIELSFGKYLLAITSRKLAATLQTHKIWKITGVVAIPIGAGKPVDISALPDKDLGKHAVDQEILKSIKEIFHSGRLYYSNTYDVTHSIQHNYFSKAVKPTSTIVDDRYFFNQNLQKELIKANNAENDTSPWITKIIAGFAGTIDVDLKEADNKAITYQVLLISRINHRRLGTRYVRRGLDYEGNVANNVEMEQIVLNQDFLKDKSISSYVQLRGSVPSIWGQDLDLSYRPRLVLADIKDDSVWKPIKTHYHDLKHQYIGERGFQAGMDNGTVVCVNLLNDDGFEGPLTNIYENSVKKFGDSKIKYENFAMNKFCKNGNFDKIEILKDRVHLPLINSGWFIAEGDLPSLQSAGTLRVSKIQTGLARVSCLDSLDRTNLTCSIFARYMLPYQVQGISPGLPSVQVLPATGVAPSEVRDTVSTTRKALEGCYTNLTCLWADSGDSISLMYAGTGALKADVTRSGKRQIQGLYNDGMNSLTRYYLNNFTHGHLQDTYDLLTGKLTVAKIIELAEVEGPKRAKRIKSPLVQRNNFPGNILPASVLNIVEPVYFNAREYLENSKVAQKEKRVVDRVLTVMKEVAPEKINTIFELIWAMYIFFWIFLITKLLKIQGQTVVDTPKLTKEIAELKAIEKK